MLKMALSYLKKEIKEMTAELANVKADKDFYPQLFTIAKTSDNVKESGKPKLRELPLTPSLKPLLQGLSPAQIPNYLQ